MNFLATIFYALYDGVLRILDGFTWLVEVIASGGRRRSPGYY